MTITILYGDQKQLDMSNFSNNKKMSAELMELLQENCRSCYICNNVIEQRPLQDLYETTSTHSNTKICDFVRKFLGSIETHRRFDANHEWNTNDGDTFVCDQCLSTINEYDLACVTAERIEKSLRAILLQTDALFVNVNKDNEESEGDVSRGDQLMDVLESESVELDELENIENVEICMVEPKIEASFDEFDDNLSQDDFETDKGEQSSETMEESRRSTRRRPLEAGGDDTKRSFECSVCQTTFSHKKDLKVLISFYSFPCIPNKFHRLYHFTTVSHRISSIETSGAASIKWKPNQMQHLQF